MTISLCGLALSRLAFAGARSAPQHFGALRICRNTVCCAQHCATTEDQRGA
jgi:hypothetical protein